MNTVHIIIVVAINDGEQGWQDMFRVIWAYMGKYKHFVEKLP